MAPVSSGRRPGGVRMLDVECSGGREGGNAAEALPACRGRRLVSGRSALTGLSAGHTHLSGESLALWPWLRWQGCCYCYPRFRFLIEAQRPP